MLIGRINDRRVIGGLMEGEVEERIGKMGRDRQNYNGGLWELQDQFYLSIVIILFKWSA
jgi:hypothetical protein